MKKAFDSTESEEIAHTDVKKIRICESQTSLQSSGLNTIRAPQIVGDVRMLKVLKESKSSIPWVPCAFGNV